jgi:hypothetical protein
MSENQVILDDVVVIGYGTQKKSDLTGSLSSIGCPSTTYNGVKSVEIEP